MIGAAGLQPPGSGLSCRISIRSRIIVEAAVGAASALAFVALAAAFVRGGEVTELDGDVSRWVAENVPGGIEWVARALGWIGGPIGSAVVAGIAAVILVRASRRTDALFVVVSLIGITILVAILKAIYERARPDLGSPIPLPHSYSFPSGHAATAVVLYGALGLLLAERARSPARAIAWLGAAAVMSVAIGVSRILLNVHFVTDVAAGFAVGLAFLCCAAIVRDVLVGANPQPVPG